LGPLIGEGIVQYNVTKVEDASKRNALFYKNGVCGTTGSSYVKVKNPYSLKNQNGKIAILINENTMSAGEMTVIAFMDKTNAKLFGQATAGYLTANKGFKLSDGSYLNIASNFVLDRSKKVYLKNITPDVKVDKNSNPDVLSTALDWINK
ncbi:MAG TPA: S41 family peptidase, partial [Pelobium sp.]